jgi:hypothetical protein
MSVPTRAAFPCLSFSRPNGKFPLMPRLQESQGIYWHDGAKTLIVTRNEMEQGPLSHRPRFARAMLRIAVAAMAVLLASCAKFEHPSKSIVVNRKVLLKDINLQPNAVTRSADGGFVIAGVRGRASAVGTTADGTLIWTYEDPRDEQVKSPFQSKFNGVVSLTDGRILLCGEKTTTGHTGLLTILDKTGNVLEQRLELPSKNRTLIHSGFYKCFRWEDGIAVTGFANDGQQGYIWIVKLDINGAKESEVLIDDRVAVTPADSTEHSFVFFSYVDSFHENLVRVDMKGNVIARRTFVGSAFLQLRSDERSNRTKLLSYSLGHRPVLYTLDQQFGDAESPKDIDFFAADKGCGFVLSDNSLALFGRTNNAAIAWISESGQLGAVMTLDPKYPSFVLSDAIPTSANQFVTVQASASPDGNDNGLVMSWVTIT